MHIQSRRLVSVIALALLTVPALASEASAATPRGTTATPAARPIDPGNGHKSGGIVPMTAPCSGVGTAIQGIQPTMYWNGCVDASAGLKARTHYGTGAVTGTEYSPETYPFGTTLHIYCYLTGPWITGYDGSATNIWDAVDWYQEPGGGLMTWHSLQPGAYVVSSDAWIYTGTDNPIVPHC